MAARFTYYDIPLVVRVKTPVDFPMAPRAIKSELKAQVLDCEVVGTRGSFSVTSAVEASLKG